MAANTSPIYPLTPNQGVMNCILSTAMTNTKAMDGTDTPGTALALAFTAGVNGSRVDTAKFRYTATNGSTATGTSAATVIRLWLNNGTTNTTATNNKFLGEMSMPAQVVTALATGTMPEYVMTLGFSIPNGYKIYAGSTVAAGGVLAFLVDVSGGDY